MNCYIIAFIIVLILIFYILISIITFNINNPQFSTISYWKDCKRKSKTIKNPDPTTKEVRESFLWPYNLIKDVIDTFAEIFLKTFNFILVLFGIKNTYKR